MIPKSVHDLFVLLDRCAVPTPPEMIIPLEDAIDPALQGWEAAGWAETSKRPQLARTMCLVRVWQELIDGAPVRVSAEVSDLIMGLVKDSLPMAAAELWPDRSDVIGVKNRAKLKRANC